MQGNDAKFSDMLEFLLEGKNICPSSQVYEAPSIWPRSQTSSVLFIVLFKVDTNFSIFAINIILIYRRLKLSENDSDSSVSKLVGNGNAYPHEDFFTFELSTAHSSKPVRVEEIRSLDYALGYLV